MAYLDTPALGFTVFSVESLVKSQNQSCDYISYEAENNFVCTSIKQKYILQCFTFITHIFLKVIKGQGPLEREGVEVGLLNFLSSKLFIIISTLI